MTVKLSPDALEDVQNITDYISDVLLEPETARALVERIFKRFDLLGVMPYMYRVCDFEPLQSRECRMFSEDSYVIFYRVDEEAAEVLIERIVYGRSDYKNAENDNK